MVKAVLLISFTFIISVLSNQDPRTKINQSELKGIYRYTLKGRKISAFSGIPYARPPVGELRFMPPQPVDSWTDALDATKPRDSCPQINIFLNNYTITGNEDCLYLNVYTPKITNFHKDLFPVIIFIHGGGFTCGSANPAEYGPDILLDKDAVLVTLNYRLGALGFLSTENSIVPGNNGLKDQNLAIRWVKENIYNFGGDPEKIIITGQSAGGASVHYQIISPLSRGLIKGAIALSGSALAPWALAPKGQNYKNTKTLAQLLNCTSNSNREMVKCLWTVDAYDIVKQDIAFMKYHYDPLIPFKPVVEENVENAFLPAHPIEIIKSGEIPKIPIIFGITSEEGALKSAALYNSSKLISQLNKNFLEILPISLLYDDTTADKDAISRKIKQFYFGDHPIDYTKKSQLTDLYTDAWILYDTSVSIQLHHKYTTGPVYCYVFGYKGPITLTPYFGDATSDYGVCHGDDLMYIMSSKIFDGYKLTEPDQKIIDVLTTTWENMVNFGNPTPTTNELFTTKWEPVKDGSMSCYFIKSGDDMQMVSDMYSERIKFWEQLATKEFKKSAVKTEL